MRYHARTIVAIVLSVSWGAHGFLSPSQPVSRNQRCNLKHLSTSSPKASSFGGPSAFRSVQNTRYRTGRTLLNEAPKTKRGLQKIRRLLGLRNRLFLQMNDLQLGMGWLVPAIAVGVWLFLATLSFERIESWPAGQSFFYVIDTGLCRGFGSVKPSTAFGQVLHTTAHHSANESCRVTRHRVSASRPRPSPTRCSARAPRRCCSGSLRSAYSKTPRRPARWLRFSPRAFSPPISFLLFSCGSGMDEGA